MMINDTPRQVLVVLAAFGTPLAANLPQLTGTGRVIGEQSEASRTLIVPWPPAFAIWGPIFLGLLGYAVLQSLPRNRCRTVYRESGLWLLMALALTILWSFAASYTPLPLSRWLTACLFVPLTVFACQSMIGINAHRSALNVVEQTFVWGAISLYAGWCSLAAFVNWAQPLQYGLPVAFDAVWVGLAMIGLALIWIVWNLQRAEGNPVYAFPVIWGLAFLAWERFVVETNAWPIGAAALAGIAIVGAQLARARRKPASSPS